MMPTGWQGLRAPAAKTLCRLLGHVYPATIAPGCALHFCARCGKEVLDRPMDSVNDLSPMPDDLRDQLDNEEQL